MLRSAPFAAWGCPPHLACVVPSTGAPVDFADSRSCTTHVRFVTVLARRILRGRLHIGEGPSAASYTMIRLSRMLHRRCPAVHWTPVVETPARISIVETTMPRLLNPIAAAFACLALLAACGEPSKSSASSAPTSSTAAAPSPPATPAPAVPIPPPPAPTAGDSAVTAKDSAATDPKGTLNKQEESKSMPMAGHGNNHSSPALEPAPKK
jgi:hypothetical protein